MNCLTWGELKKMVRQQEEVKDTDPIYISITEQEDDGSSVGTTYAMETVSFRCGGGVIEFCGTPGGMDDEDEENLG